MNVHRPLVLIQTDSPVLAIEQAAIASEEVCHDLYRYVLECDLTKEPINTFEVAGGWRRIEKIEYVCGLLVIPQKAVAIVFEGEEAREIWEASEGGKDLRLTTKQAAKYLGCAVSTVLRYVRDGELKSDRRAGCHFFTIEDLNRFPG